MSTGTRPCALKLSLLVIFMCSCMSWRCLVLQQLWWLAPSGTLQLAARCWCFAAACSNALIANLIVSWEGRLDGFDAVLRTAAKQAKGVTLSAVPAIPLRFIWYLVQQQQRHLRVAAHQMHCVCMAMAQEDRCQVDSILLPSTQPNVWCSAGVCAPVHCWSCCGIKCQACSGLLYQEAFLASCLLTPLCTLPSRNAPSSC